MIGNQSQRYSSSKQPLKGEGVDYRQLYLECKKNVTVFMQHVDGELTAILKTHEEEKKRLKEEIQLLKSQLKRQSATSVRQPALNRRTNSQPKVNTRQSVSKEAVEECLGKLNFDFKTAVSEKKDESEVFGGVTRNRLKLKQESQKENFILPDNLNVGVEIDLKMMNSSRWEKRLRERKPVIVEKADGIKDVLRDIRGRVGSKRVASQPKGEEGGIDIIKPGMFTSRNE